LCDVSVKSLKAIEIQAYFSSDFHLHPELEVTLFQVETMLQSAISPPTSEVAQKFQRLSLHFRGRPIQWD